MPIDGFQGTFNGNGFEIQNLKITENEIPGDEAGFTIGKNENAKFLNIVIRNVDISATKSDYLGTLVGGGLASTWTECVVSNVSICGTIKLKGKKYVGGVVCGLHYKHGIYDCHVDGGDASESTIETIGSKAGGLTGTGVSGTGDSSKAICYDCTVKNVTITGPAELGGFAGRAFRFASFVNCSVENVIIKASDTAKIGAYIGDPYDGYGDGRFIINCTAKSVSLRNAEDVEIGMRELGGTVTLTMIGTDVAGNGFATMSNDFDLTAGTFTNLGGEEAMVNALTAQIADGYIAKQTGVNTYTIVPVFNVTIDDQIVNDKVAADKTTAEAGETITLTVTADQGFKLDTIAASTADGAVTLTTVTEGTTYTFEMPAAAVTVTAEFVKDAQPVNPEEPTQYDDVDKAKAAADAINAAKETMIITPTGAVAADYTALFTAVVTADNKVVVELNETGTNTLQTSANAVEAQVAEQLANISTATEITVTPAATDIVPGFYYGLAATADVSAMKNANPAEWKQATTEGIADGLTADKPSADKGFFQIKVSVKAPVTETPVE